MDRAVMGGAEGYDPFVADLAAQGTGFGESKMVGLTGRAPADEAG